MPDRGKAYEAILAIVVGLLLVYYFTSRIWILQGVIALIVITMLVPWTAIRVAWAWGKLAEGLNYLTSRLILGAIFYLLLTPMAFFQKLLGKNALQLKVPNSTAFTDRDHEYQASDLKDQW